MGLRKLQQLCTVPTLRQYAAVAAFQLKLNVVSMFPVRNGEAEGDGITAQNMHNTKG